MIITIYNCELFYSDHFDSKARVEDYIMEKAGSMIWNSVRMPIYFNNFLTNTKPRKLDDGSYIMGYPMEGKPTYAMDVDDLGGCVASTIIFCFFTVFVRLTLMDNIHKIWLVYTVAAITMKLHANTYLS